MEQLKGLWQVAASRDILSTLLLLATLVILRWLALRFLRRDERLSKELKLRWQNFIKNAFILVGFIGLVLIWAPQLRAFALSLTAVAVAVVVALKELILCLSGSLLRASSSSFYIGDLIEFAGHTGYVVDQNLLTTQLQEVDAISGDATGKQISLPNSLFLSHSVKNHSQLRPYCVHSFALYIESAQAGNIDALTETVQKSAQTISRETAAEDAFSKLSPWKQDLLSQAGPCLHLRSTELARIGFNVKLVCHESDCMDKQAEVTRAFYRCLAQAQPAPA